MNAQVLLKETIPFTPKVIFRSLQSSMGSDVNKLSSLLVEHDTSKSEEEVVQDTSEEGGSETPTEGEVRIVALVKEAAEFGLF